MVSLAGLQFGDDMVVLLLAQTVAYHDSSCDDPEDARHGAESMVYDLLDGIRLYHVGVT